MVRAWVRAIACERLLKEMDEFFELPLAGIWEEGKTYRKREGW
jgi:hypothetical protein